jgi:hypothetical protein
MAARTDLVAFVPGRLVAALADPLGPPRNPYRLSIRALRAVHVPPDPARSRSGSIWLRNHVSCGRTGTLLSRNAALLESAVLP